LLDNKLSQSSHVRRTLKNELTKVEILQDNIVVPYEHLERTSSTLDATAVTESLQFRERGLLHISDSAFNFFLALEQERVNRINMEKISLHKTDLVDEALTEVLQHKDLQQMFFKLFDAADDDSVSNKFNW
jgi:hypothetical protein